MKKIDIMNIVRDNCYNNYQSDEGIISKITEEIYEEPLYLATDDELTDIFKKHLYNSRGFKYER